MTLPEAISARATTSGTIRFADLEVDLERQTVLRAGRRLPVKNRSFQLLQFLIERYPATAGNRELLGAVWKGLVVTPDALTQRVRLLRKALGDENGDAGYIVSVHGQGYRLSAPPMRREVTAVGMSPRRSIRGKAALIGLGVALFFLISVLMRDDALHAIKHFLRHTHV